MQRQSRDRVLPHLQECESAVYLHRRGRPGVLLSRRHASARGQEDSPRLVQPRGVTPTLAFLLLSVDVLVGMKWPNFVCETH